MVVAFHFGLLGAARINANNPTAMRAVWHESCRQRFDRTEPDYFPMQNVLKIRFNMSSFVVAPVMASSGRSAP
jgi:hypothetical protein